MRKYKYDFVHIFTIGNTYFPNRFAELISDIDSQNKDKHFFVIRLTDQYRDFNPSFKNMELIFNNYIAIKRYYKTGKVIVVHNMTKYILKQLSTKSLLQRTIWRSWGSDVKIARPPQPIKLFGRLHYPHYYVNAIKYYLRIKKCHIFEKYLLGFAGANIIDEINMFNNYQRKVFFYINYFGTRLIENKPNKITWFDNNKTKIMVGHSGFPSEKHIDIIDKLLSFEDCKQSIIIVPVVYGESEYINKIVERYQGIDNVVLLCSSYPEDEYNWILKNIDVAILGSNNSTGLGTICKLLRYQKTFWLSKNGIIANGFKNDCIPFYNVEELNNDIFKKGKALVYKPDNSSISYPSKSQLIERWAYIKKYINN